MKKYITISVIIFLLVLGSLSYVFGNNKPDKIEWNDELLSYKDMTYADYLNSGGVNAEFYHGGRFTATIPKSDVEIIFVGDYDEETGEYVLSDSATAIRLQGAIDKFCVGVTGSLSVEKFLDELASQYTIKYSIREGGGTAYYPADNYIAVECDCDGDQVMDIELDISLDQSDKIEPDTFCWLMWI